MRLDGHVFTEVFSSGGVGKVSARVEEGKLHYLLLELPYGGGLLQAFREHVDAVWQCSPIALSPQKVQRLCEVAVWSSPKKLEEEVFRTVGKSVKVSSTETTFSFEVKDGFKRLVVLRGKLENGREVEEELYVESLPLGNGSFLRGLFLKHGSSLIPLRSEVYTKASFPFASLKVVQSVHVDGRTLKELYLGLFKLDLPAVKRTLEKLEVIPTDDKFYGLLSVGEEEEVYVSYDKDGYEWKIELGGARSFGSSSVVGEKLVQGFEKLAREKTEESLSEFLDLCENLLSNRKRRVGI